MLTTFDRTRDGKIVAAFRLEKDDLQPQNETWSSKRSVNCRRLSYDNTENHAAASVLPLTRRFRKHESARASPARTSATPTASITSGARREASTAANWRRVGPVGDAIGAAAAGNLTDAHIAQKDSNYSVFIPY